MKRILHRILILAAATAAIGTQAFAIDIITKKSDGKKVNGTISAMSKTEVTVKKLQGDETVPANDIAAIEWDGGGPELRLAYLDEAGQRYDMAIQRFTKAKADAKSPSEALQAEYDYGLARVLGKQSLSDPDKRDEAIKKLQAVQKAHADHFRYFESLQLLSDIQLAAKDFNAARATLELIKRAPWNDLQLAARIGEGRILIAEGKTDQAITEFAGVVSAAGNSPNEQDRKYEAMLGQARGLITQTKYDDALKLLDTVTDQSPIENSAVQAEAYILEGQALQAVGKVKEAVLAYLHVDLLFPREAGYHAEALYYLSQLWKQIQHPERGADAANKLAQNYPNSDWRKRLGSSE